MKTERVIVAWTPEVNATAPPAALILWLLVTLLELKVVRSMSMTVLPLAKRAPPYPPGKTWFSLNVTFRTTMKPSCDGKRVNGEEGVL